MIFNKNKIDKISEEHLEWLIKNQNLLTEVPSEVDKNIINLLREKSKYINKCIEEKSKKKGFIFNNFKYILIAASIFIIIAFGLVFNSFYNRIIKDKSSICKIEKTEGKILINNKLYNENSKDKISLNNKTIITKEKSNIEIHIGDNSIIKINELSNLKIIQIKKDMLDEFNKVYLKNGSIDCSISLPTINSGFAVQTNTGLFTVKGTQFNITIKEDKNIILTVEKGIVEVSNFISDDLKLEKTKKKNNDIYLQLMKIKGYKILIQPNESITLKHDFIKEYNKNLLTLVNDINEANSKKTEKNHYLLMLMNKLNALDNQKNDLYILSKKAKNDNIVKDITNENKIIINKIALKLEINLSEYDTAVTSDNIKYLYISNDSNKKVFCIDLFTEKLKWIFSNDKITNISSPVIPYKNKLILATPNIILILNEAGKIIDSKKIKMGPSYWAYPLINNNFLYIPSFNTIYKYDGQDIKILNDSLETNGQIYLTSNNGFLYFSVLNEKKIKKFSISENKIVGESDSFSERSFMPPVVSSQNIFIADISGNIYKYDLNTNIKKQIKIDSGIISSMRYYNNYLYFIAINGYFYKIKADDLSKPEKLFLIDNNLNKDKYLTKKMLIKNNKIYFCSNMGKLFIYNSDNNHSELISIPDNINNSPLIGSPVETGKDIFILDAEANIYRVTGLE